jgi:hypothetical protein
MAGCCVHGNEPSGSINYGGETGLFKKDGVV